MSLLSLPALLAHLRSSSFMWLRITVAASVGLVFSCSDSEGPGESTATTTASEGSQNGALGTENDDDGDSSQLDGLWRRSCSEEALAQWSGSYLLSVVSRDAGYDDTNPFSIILNSRNLEIGSEHRIDFLASGRMELFESGGGGQGVINRGFTEQCRATENTLEAFYSMDQISPNAFAKVEFSQAEQTVRHTFYEIETGVTDKTAFVPETYIWEMSGDLASKE